MHGQQNIIFKYLGFKEELYPLDCNVYSVRAVPLHTGTCVFCCNDHTNSKTGNCVLRDL